MKSIGHAASGALVELLRAAPLSPGKVEFAWKAAVGPAMGRSTFVRLEGTRLLVDAASPEWARELLRSSRVVLSRLQALLGAEAVDEIVVRAEARDARR